ncbi:MAG: hypothetical protein RR942_18900 [Romboutsia sp.]
MKQLLKKPVDSKNVYKNQVVTFSLGKGSKQPECRHNNCYNCK